VYRQREVEKVEGFGLSLSKSRTPLGRLAAEADPPGLVRVQRQFERAQSFVHRHAGTIDEFVCSSEGSPARRAAHYCLPLIYLVYTEAGCSISISYASANNFSS